MQNSYILINKNNEVLSFYYGEERSIYCKKIGTNNYTISNKVIQNVTEYFTVDIGPNKEIYIFCQNYNGDVILCKLEEDGFKQKILFKNKSEMPESIFFYPIFFKGNMSLIYNNSSLNNNFLSIRTLVGGKNWSDVENIDTFSILPNNIFNMYKINQDNIVIAYKKKGKDIQIGYKEIINGCISNFVTIHKTGYQIVDYSFISFKNVIHYVYIIKSLFSSQVIYRKKDENGISSPIILFEGQKIKSCNINLLNNSLYCSFIVNSTLFYCQSDDFGRTFSSISKYRRLLSQDIIKAKFISTNNIENSCINEVYIDAKNTLNIYLLSDILPNLFSKKQDINQNINSTNIDNQEKFITNLNNQFINNVDNVNENSYNNITSNSNKLKNTVVLENDFMANFNPEEFSKFNINKEINGYIEKDFNKVNNADNDINSNVILENRFKMLNEQLNEKNSQILKLNDIIQNKNNEHINIQMVLREKIKNVENENNNLLKKLEKLEKKIENLKDIDKPVKLENENTNSKDKEITSYEK